MGSRSGSRSSRSRFRRCGHPFRSRLGR